MPQLLQDILERKTRRPQPIEKRQQRNWPSGPPMERACLAGASLQEACSYLAAGWRAMLTAEAVMSIATMTTTKNAPLAIPTTIINLTIITASLREPLTVPWGGRRESYHNVIQLRRKPKPHYSKTRLIL